MFDRRRSSDAINRSRSRSRSRSDSERRSFIDFEILESSRSSRLSRDFVSSSFAFDVDRDVFLLEHQSRQFFDSTSYVSDSSFHEFSLSLSIASSSRSSSVSSSSDFSSIAFDAYLSNSLNALVASVTLDFSTLSSSRFDISIRSCFFARIMTSLLTRNCRFSPFSRSTSTRVSETIQHLSRSRSTLSELMFVAFTSSISLSITFAKCVEFLSIFVTTSAE